jgi:CheY-like chemotaxis protein
LIIAVLCIKDIMSTLFVVDDNEMDQCIIKFNLVKYPVFNSVSYYNGGLPLIDYLIKHQNNSESLPDAIFLDLSMPEYDGWEVLDALNTIYPMLSKKINVYIVSASIFSKDIDRAQKYYFVKNFISKPFTSNNLISISRDLINISA